MIDFSDNFPHLDLIFACTNFQYEELLKIIRSKRQDYKEFVEKLKELRFPVAKFPKLVSIYSSIMPKINYLNKKP